MKKNYIKTIVFALLITIMSCRKHNIIENPITGKKVLVAKQDFPNKMTWDEAKVACSLLGEGWRLPTSDELFTMNGISVHIDNYKYEEEHWTSSEFGEDQERAIVLQYSLSYDQLKKKEYAVRAVKDAE